MTLVELLVVVFILLAITATAIPVVVPSLQERQIRETSRLVTSYFAGARDRAMHRGRPVGVMIERFPGEPRLAFVLSEVEVPPPYAGDTPDARLTLQITGTVADDPGKAKPQPGSVSLTAQPSPPGTLTWQLLRVGDELIVGNQGHRYRIVGPSDPTDPERRINGLPLELELELDVVYPDPMNLGSFKAPLPWTTTASAPQPYKIVRTPKKTARPPLVLPEGLCIDLQFSSDETEFFIPGDFDGDPNNELQDPTPVIVMFAPSGAVERIFHSVAGNAEFEDHPPIGTLYFLIGQREKVPVNGKSTNKTEEDTNLLTLGNRWITIQPQTGAIHSNPLSPVDPADANADWGTDPQKFVAAVTAARRDARGNQTEGGR